MSSRAELEAAKQATLEKSMGMYANLIRDLSTIVKDEEIDLALNNWANQIDTMVRKFSELCPDDRLVVSLLSLGAEGSKAAIGQGLDTLVVTMMSGLLHGRKEI